MTENKPQWRSDPARQKAQVAATNRAWHRAVKLLIAENRERYQLIYDREAAAESVTAKGPNRRTRPRRAKSEADEVKHLQRKLARLQAQLDTIDGES